MVSRPSASIHQFFLQVLEKRQISQSEFRAVAGLSSRAREALLGAGDVEIVPLREIFTALTTLKLSPDEYTEFTRLFDGLSLAIRQKAEG